MSRSPGVQRCVSGKWLGRRPYAPVHELQLELHAARAEGRIGDTVLFVEHEPVVTQGRGAKAAHLLASRELLKQRGVDLVETGRGGDVTLHAPGQFVCYPIFDLSPDRRDVRRYVSDLARVMQRLIAREFGLEGGLVDGLVGLWVDPENPKVWSGPQNAAKLAKIGAIGVRISRWVTMHGFALNIAMDMSLFDLIVPCGIRDHGVVSAEMLCGTCPPLRHLAESALVALGEVFEADISPLDDCSQADLSALPFRDP